MSWDGLERRRSSLTISGPWSLRVIFVGTPWVALWLSVGIIVGLLIALSAYVGAGR